VTFSKLLVERRRGILDDWFERIVKSYPKSMGDYLRGKRDRFGNPVGGTIREGVEAVFDALCVGAGEDELAMALDRTVRLRAIQAFSPSEAVGYVFELKPAVRRAFKAELAKGRLLREVEAFETRIDEVALVAFDAYMSCRERLMKIRSNEARNLARNLLERSGLSFPGSSFEERPSVKAPPEKGRSEV
jgi:hypothetical protein